MLKTKQFIKPETYVSPACKVVYTTVEQVLCVSNEKYEVEDDYNPWS